VRPEDLRLDHDQIVIGIEAPGPHRSALEDEHVRAHAAGEEVPDGLVPETCRAATGR
jgi:hypothetical protein